MISKKMVWLRVVLIACLLFVQVGFTQIRETGVIQQIQQDTELRMELDLPENAVVGSTPERKAAWDALSEKEREDLLKLVGPYLDAAVKNRRQNTQLRENSIAKPPSQIGYVDFNGVHKKVSTDGSFSREIIQGFGNFWAADDSLDSLNRETISTRSIPAGMMPANMPLNFSETLADMFTPYYHISGDEWADFVTLQQYNDDMAISQYHGRNPVSYYRVHPMGFGTVSGAPYGFFKLDYLTIWNRDDGLPVNPWAWIHPIILDLFFDYSPWVYVELFTLGVLNPIAFAHEWDVERSAVLVGAPLVSGTYNPNPSAYYIHGAYAAAHEDTFTDHSAYAPISQPFQGHIELFLSLSKHGTYFGNPMGLPLMPAWLIDESYFALQLLFLDGRINFGQYSAYLNLLDVAFFEGITERFYPGGNNAYAAPRINVGEPVAGQILNGCNFILDTSDDDNKYTVNEKLQTPIWIDFY